MILTVDTNIVVYANLDETKSERARQVLAKADFVSVQILNEFANVMSRKYRFAWSDVTEALNDLIVLVSNVHPINRYATGEAIRLASRYKLAFYDALMLAVALEGGAQTFYSEDMQHGLVVDDELLLVDPFR